jgi:hypothetical protein
MLKAPEIEITAQRGSAQSLPISAKQHGCWIAAFALIGLLYTYLFYPGTMDWDSATIAKMAEAGSYKTWFPPAFTFVWRTTAKVGANPGTIWLLQTVLLLIGLYLLTASLLKRGYPGLAAAVPVSALAPPFAYLFHEMTKDTFLMATLFCLSGLAAFFLSEPAQDTTARRWRLIAALALAALALSTRYNAIFALVPVFWLVVHAITRLGIVRSLSISVISLLLLVAGLSVVSRHVLKALWSPPETALIAFDLAGMTKFSGTPASRLAESKEHRDQIDRCYSPKAWDSLKWNDCATGYSGQVFRAYRKGSGYVLGEWAAAIVNHPLAYARHRTAHFFSLLRVTREAASEMGIPFRQAVHNPSGSEVRTPALAVRYEELARDFFWVVRPWLVLLGALALAAWAARRALMCRAVDASIPWMVVAFCASAVLYTSAYLVVGVASQFRYVYWAYQALWLAVVIAPSIALGPGTLGLRLYGAGAAPPKERFEAPTAGAPSPAAMGAVSERR